MTGEGRFLVLDGPDGSGKSTQASRLCAWLAAEGRRVAHLRDPGGTRIGEKIRALLLDPEHREIDVRAEVLLFMASRAQLAAERIRPALSRGEVVVCERWIGATLSYQGRGGGGGEEEILSLCAYAVGGLRPDLMLILDVDPAEGLARIGRPRDLMEERPLDYHRRVREGFLDLASRGLLEARLIPAGGPDAVEASIRSAVSDVL
ncbi:MAG: dTMP kinase [Planctomycetes bacterium]|jgi:dTMP kinase|nr:dTMP kinase [Planctomycetota bacterium]